MSPQIIEIFLFAAVAAFLLFRLRSVLGTRDGHESTPESLREARLRHPENHGESEKQAPGVVLPIRPDSSREARESEAPELATLDRDDPKRGPLQAMIELEPNFTMAEFLEGAKHAYEIILSAYERGEKETLRPLLAEDVYNDFAEIIDDRASKGLVVDGRFVGVRDATIENIEFDPDTQKAEITVRFSADTVTAVRNADGDIVEGDPKKVRRQGNNWTFERVFGEMDPNWTLVET